MPEPPSDICGHEFTWESTAIPSGDIETTAGKVTGVSFGETTIKNRTCARQTLKGKDKCFWHTEVRSPKNIEEILAEETEDIVCNAKIGDLSGVSLSGMSFPDSEFYGQLVDVDIRNSILVFSLFEDCDLIDVDLSGSNLQETRFTGSDIKQGRKQLGGKFSSCKCEGADFAEVTLQNADFSEASFNHTTIFDPDRTISSISFKEADLSDADFSDVSLADSVFTEANLRGTNFTESRLSGSKFEAAICMGTNFEEAELENVDFTGANLEGAGFKNAEFHSAVFTDAQIDYNTQLDSTSIYEREQVADDKFENRETRVLKALWTYRVLQKLCRENALLDKTRSYYIKEKDLRRRQYYREWSNDPNSNILIEYDGGPRWKYKLRVLTSILKAEGSNRIIRYGEGPWQIIKSSVAIIFLFAVVYPLFGLRNGETTIQYSLSKSAVAGFPEQISYIIQVVLFSVFTFTRAGLSEYSPVGGGQVLAAGQGALGALFIALLVFVLGRRTTY